LAQRPIYTYYNDFGLSAIIKLTTAPIVMYIVGIINEINTENDLKTVSAFFTNTAFSC
jgi:hypothetical protein